MIKPSPTLPIEAEPDIEKQGLPTLDDRMAEHTVNRYVCSQCWGPLLKRPAPNREWIVECSKCGPETRGYVTQYYTERRRKESLAEAREVTRMLITLNVIMRRSYADAIRELGF